MERLENIDELPADERIARFHRIMKAVIGVDDLFPPEGGVREPAQPPRRPIHPKAGAVVLQIVNQELVLV